jgi:glycerol kinase
VVDVLEAIHAEQGLPSQIRADGGLAASRVLLQREADLSGRAIVAALDRETTAAGAASFAAIAVDALDLETVAARVNLAPPIEPSIDPSVREQRRHDWRAFVARTTGLDPDQPSAIA